MPQYELYYSVLLKSSVTIAVEAADVAALPSPAPATTALLEAASSDDARKRRHNITAATKCAACLGSPAVPTLGLPHCGSHSSIGHVRVRPSSLVLFIAVCHRSKSNVRAPVISLTISK
jgi:hypothetical protein